MNTTEIIEQRMLRRYKTIEYLKDKQYKDNETLTGVPDDKETFQSKKKIMSVVSRLTEINAYRAFSKTYTGKICRKRELVEFRQLYFYLCKKFTNETLSSIAKISIGDVVHYQYDHSSVIHSIKTIGDLIETDPKIRERTERAIRLLSI